MTKMAKGSKKELTSDEIKKQAIHKMLESLISGNSEDASDHLHNYLQIKTQEIVLGEKAKDSDCEKKEDDEEDDEEDDKEKVDEQTMSSAFANSGTVMSDDITGKVKYENGGKKTLKKHGNAPKELDDDKVGKVKFKSGGKQPAKTLEKTPKPDKFDDGREKGLGTTNT